MDTARIKRAKERGRQCRQLTSPQSERADDPPQVASRERNGDRARTAGALIRCRRTRSGTLWPLPHSGRRDEVRDQARGHTVAGPSRNHWGTPSRPRNRRVRRDGALRSREGGVPRKFRREGWSPIFCACASTQKSRGCYGRRQSAWGGPRVAGMTIEKEEKTGVKWQAGVHVCTGCSNPRHPVRWLRS